VTIKQSSSSQRPKSCLDAKLRGAAPLEIASADSEWGAIAIQPRTSRSAGVSVVARLLPAKRPIRVGQSSATGTLGGRGSSRPFATADSTVAESSQFEFFQELGG